MSASQLTLVVSTVIARPVDVVRQHFADVDHAIRDNVHAGVAMRWLPPQVPGERRVRQEVRLLGRPHVDEFVLEEGDDGAVLKRFVEGAKKGTVLHESFAPEGDGATRVRVVATLPAAGLKRAIGPLFKLAVRLSVAKTLAEHKRDLEGGGYEPGRARGHVEAALRDALAAVVPRAAALADDHERVALVTPLLEAACVAAVADNDADDAERDAILAAVRAVGVAALDADALRALVASSIDRTRAEGLERRCDELGGQLRRLDLAAPGLTVAAVVAQVSHGLDPAELAVLQRMALAAGVDDDALAAMIERVDRQLSSGTAT